MQTKQLATLVGSLFCSVMTASAQGTFRNMDFELSQVPQSTPDQTTVASSTAFPFWTTYLGTSQQTTVLYNGVTAGTAAVVLLSSYSPVWANSIVQGHYTAVLAAGGVFGEASISQTGVIPDTAMSLLFSASVPYAAGWSVSIGNQVIPVIEVSQSGNYAVYGADISGFAGRTEELRFTALGGPGTPSQMLLDAIQFSSVAVPEPRACALLTAGGLLVALRVFRRKK